MTLTHGSLFAGIGGFDLGFGQANIQTIWQVENDPSAVKVLEEQLPGIKRYGDVEEIERIEKCDILSAGFPCQDLSVAGKRKGLAGARSGLFWEIIRITRKILPQWVLIENVPGLFTSDDGRDFGTVLAALGELGYGVAWRVFNSQYFGVPQRRRRVFIVGYFGAVCPGEILFESESGAGNFNASGEAGAEVARTIKQSSTSYSNRQGGINQTLIARTLTGGVAGGSSHGKRSGDDRQTLVSALHFSGGPYDNDAQAGHIVAAPLTARDAKGLLPDRALGNVVWHNKQQASEVREYDDISPAVTQQWGTGGNNTAMVGVSRLTPLECERLQGFPDGWTACIKPEDFQALYIDGKYYSQQELSDSARYRLLGNAVTVNVAEWLGKRMGDYNASHL